MSELYHGGNIFQISKETGIPPEEILDFSASLNPLGLPEGALKILQGPERLLRAYPEPWAESLREALSEHYGIDRASILCGAGSSPLLYATASVLSPEEVALFSPTFTEYERAFRASRKDVSIHYIPLREDRDFSPEIDDICNALLRVECLLLCNPNNPTGVVLKREALEEVLSLAKKKKKKVVIDEAFIDFVPEHSIVDLIRDYPDLIILRSLTKFFGIAGLRVGFMVSNPSMIERIKEKVPPWMVSQTGIEVSKVLLIDREFHQRIFNWLEQEKKFLEEGLRRLNIRFFPSSVNYYLVKVPEAEKLYHCLLKKGILLRLCHDFKGLGKDFLRISLLDRQKNALLVEGIRECIENT